MTNYLFLTCQKANFQISSLSSILREERENFPSVTAKIKSGECTHEHEGEHYSLGEIPSQIISQISDALTLFDTLNILD